MSNRMMRRCLFLVLAILLCVSPTVFGVAFRYTVQSNVTTGDVLIFSAVTAYGVETTTSSAALNVAGVSTETRTSGQKADVSFVTGRATVNVTSATAQQWLITSTTIGKAVGVDDFQAGVFGRAITSAGDPAAGQCYAQIAPHWLLVYLAEGDIDTEAKWLNTSWIGRALTSYSRR